MSLTKWFNYLFLILLGLSLIFVAYKINESYEEEIYIQQHSPEIEMRVVNRLKSWGTVRYPNKICVRYKGKNYVLSCSNQYFKATAQLDSIAVHYDPLRDRAVLAVGNVTVPYVLLLLIVLMGLIAVVSTAVDLRRQLAKNSRLT